MSVVEGLAKLDEALVSDTVVAQVQVVHTVFAMSLEQGADVHSMVIREVASREIYVAHDGLVLE